MSDPAPWVFVRDGGLDQKPPEGHPDPADNPYGGSDDMCNDGDEGDDYVAMARLWDRMAELVADSGDRAEAFGYTLRSGVWTHHHNGDACDSRRALARTSEAQ